MVSGSARLPDPAQIRFLLGETLTDQSEAAAGLLTVLQSVLCRVLKVFFLDAGCVI